MNWRSTGLLMLICLGPWGCGSDGNNELAQTLKPTAGVFEESPCPIEVPDGVVVEGETLQCGYMTVPEEHSKPDGRKIRLPVAVFSSLGGEPTPTAFVMLPAGPGNSALAQFGPLIASDAGKVFRQKHDVVLVGPRGTLFSEPDLFCEGTSDPGVEAEQQLSPEEARVLTRRKIQQCRDDLTSEGINLSAYNSLEMAADVIASLKALGYEKFSLYGTSAGALLAQHLMRDYGEYLQAVLIDSVPPLGVAGQSSVPANGARSLQRVFERCEADPACNEAFPNLEKSLASTIEELNRSPVRLAVEGEAGSSLSDVVVTGGRLAGLIFQLCGGDDTVPVVPHLVHATAIGDYSVLERFAGGMGPLPSSFAVALSRSVICSEAADYTEDDIEFADIYPAFENALADWDLGPRGWLSACAAWKVEELDQSAREAVHSDVDALIFAGEFDNWTPPEWGRIAARTLENSHYYVLPGASHSATGSGPCAFSIAARFLNEPTSEPDASCIQEMGVKFELPN